MKELKPCPFCGGDAVLNCIEDTENGAEWWVEHFRCGSNVGIETDFMKSPDEAIAAWNTRVERTCHNKTYGNYLHCSSCDKRIYRGDRQFNYCPNCGAKAVEQ